MNDLNKFMVIGRLVKDPELKYTQGGTTIGTFSIANNSEYKEKKEVSYFDCVVFGKVADVCSQYLFKGSQVCVEGRFKQRNWEDRNGQKHYKFELTVSFIQFLNTKKKEDIPEHIIDSGEEIPISENPFSDSNIPF